MRTHKLMAGLSALAATALLTPDEAWAGKFVFPYHHPDLNWYTIETDHFYVHYPVSKKPKDKAKHHVDASFMAQRSAKVAEEMWEPMCEQFDYYLTEKVHIVLIDQSDDLEGFTIPAWNWIEISGNPGGYFYRMRGRMEWFSDVLVHEFAHVVSLKRNTPMGEGAGAVILTTLYRDGLRNQESGGEITLMDTDPFWWTEGGAEYWSDNAGYNWWTAARDMNIRTSVLEDRLLTYEEWITRIEKRDWGDGERGYQQGYSFGLYMRERFGDETYAKFSQESSKKWRANWETIVEDVTGLTVRELYVDWVDYLTVKYNRVYDEVKEEGEVVGGELEVSTGPWVAKDPDARDAWLAQEDVKKKGKKKGAAEDAKEATGRWDFYPKMSDDGRWIGEHSSSAGFAFVQYPEELLPPIAGQDPDPAAHADAMQRAADSSYAAIYPLYGSAFGHAFDFVPGRDAAVISGNEDMLPKLTGWARVETDGYNWGQLYVLDLAPNPKPGKRKHAGGTIEHDSWKTKHFLEGTLASDDKWRYTPIPNTERGADPAVSPDGTKVAYFEYGDGTLNLVTINLDGSDKKYLTNFRDGTWLQNVDWSPDGKQLVFSMLHNFRQDLWVINADGTEFRALNRDAWEDQDAHWAKDGWIYFSSEPEGIFNVFRYNPETGQVQQITNVIGGAECPWITPQGNLLYTNFTAHGWKNFALAKDEFLLKDATHLFDFTPDQEEAQQDLAYSEDLSSFAAMARPYPKLGHWMSPTAYPMFRFENDSLTNFGLSAGAQLYAQDLIEDHVVLGNVFVGEDPLVLGMWSYQGWVPTITVFGYYSSIKYDYAFLLDDDDNLETTDDQSIFEGKQHQYVNVGRAEVSYPLNGSIDVAAFTGGFRYGFKSTQDTDFQPYLEGYYGGARLFYSNIGTGYVGSANIRSARAIDISYMRAFSDVVYPAYNGFDTDDGELLDKYAYNRIEGRWSETLPVPRLWGLLKDAHDKRHSIIADMSVGLVDRNVQVQDEFRGGGLHPSFVGSGSLQPNNQFAGYPGYSLSGETMLVGALGYRFPVLRQVNKKVGPLYFYDMYAQLGGTAGNFWSYRPPEEEGTFYYGSFGEKIAYDPSDVRREIPFVDEAYKNGNFLLYDANAELRISSVLMGANWDSFVRVAYGFNTVRGVGDVNGDDIQDTTDNGLGDALSNEVEEPGLRLYIGLGTGW